MNDRFLQCQVSLNHSLMDAMKALEKSATEIVLVINENGHLVGTMTDGDIRRALLAGAGLESLLAPFMNRNFIRVDSRAQRAEVLDLMKAWNIGQIPVLDADGRATGIHLLHELLGCKARPNWAVILAGGKGVRLRPITEHVPKPMIPVAGRPILERIILHLVGFGIGQIFVSVNYLGNMVQDYFGDGSRLGCRIEYLLETTPLGSGGPLALLPTRPQEPLLVMNGDLVTGADLVGMLNYHTSGEFKATVGLREYSHPIPFGCVDVRDGRVISLVEKPKLTQLINAGIYVLDPGLLSRIPPHREFPITELFAACLEAGEPIGAFMIEGDWIDVGTKDQLIEAKFGIPSSFSS